MSGEITALLRTTPGGGIEARGYNDQWQTVPRDAVAEIQRLTEERDEADRRAGAAERTLGNELEDLRDAARKRAEWLRKAKRRAGYEEHVSFDKVFADLLAAAEENEKLRKSVADVIEEGDGFWLPCSGCSESVDGYLSEPLWPTSKIFQRQTGAGCAECGGIGVTWQQAWTDEDARAALKGGE